MKRLIILVALVFSFLVLLCSAGRAHARDITLQWEANPETDIAGYDVYYKIDGPGIPYDGDQAALPSPIVMTLADDEDPDPAIVKYTVLGLPELQSVDQRYRFAVKARSVIGLTSIGYSNEASAGVPTDTGNLVVVSSQ